MRPAFSYAGGSTACEPVVSYAKEPGWRNMSNCANLSCRRTAQDDSAGGQALENSAGEQQKNSLENTWRTPGEHHM
jgi:hypothetical protein